MSGRRTEWLRRGLGLAAAAGAAYALERLAVSRARRRPDPYAGRPLECPTDREHRVRSTGGAELYVIERGRGVPVVLGHGVRLDCRTWVHQLETLPDEGIRAVAFDQRGHGRATPGDGFGLVALADDLRAVLETLDLRGAVVVGHSMGGIGVQSLLAHHPDVVRDRVAGLVFMSTVPATPRFSAAVSRILPLVVRGSDAVLDWLFARPDLGFLVARLGLGRRPLPSHVELTRAMNRACPAPTRRGAVVSLFGFDLTGVLERVTLPTLVVCGSGDVLTPPRVARRMAALIPGAELVILPGVGHMPMLEAADEVNRLLARFAHEVARGTAAATA